MLDISSMFDALFRMVYCKIKSNLSKKFLMSRVLFTFIASIWWYCDSELKKKTQKICVKIEIYLRYVFVIVF